MCHCPETSLGCVFVGIAQPSECHGRELYVLWAATLGTGAGRGGRGGWTEKVGGGLHVLGGDKLMLRQRAEVADQTGGRFDGPAEPSCVWQ